MKKPLTNENIYRFHVANLKSIEAALDQLALVSKDLIRKNRESLVDPILKTSLLLFGAWTECRLLKLMHEKGGFTAAERANLQKAKTQEEKWKRTIEGGFRKRYKVHKLTVHSLSHSAFSKYQALIEALDEHVGPVVQLRNKLAHGQWEYPLTNDGTAVAEKAKMQLEVENLLSANCKRQLVTHISALVHDLVVSKSFERDFDSNYRQFQQALVNIKSINYQSWKSGLRNRFEKGKLRRGLPDQDRPSA